MQIFKNNDCKTTDSQLFRDSCSMSFLSLNFSVPTTMTPACQSLSRLQTSGLCSMGALFSSWGAGEVKVEAAFSSDKYLHPGKDGAGVYYDWSVKHDKTNILINTLQNISIDIFSKNARKSWNTDLYRNTDRDIFACYLFMIFRVNGYFEPSMRAIESVTNHLRQATNDSFTFTAVGLGVTWGVLVVLVALRYVYGCRLAKEHRDPEIGLHPKAHYNQYGQQVDLVPGNQDPVVINTRRTSVAENPPSIKIKVETDN